MRRPVVLLTGASRGIGAHAARWLAKGGANLALVARDVEALAQVSTDARDLGVDVLAIPADVTEAGAADRIVGVALDHFSRLDGLINNAGIAGQVGHVATLDLDAWRRTLETNLLAPVAFFQAAARELRTQAGIVVNVTSEVADIASESIEPYAGAKAALRHLSRTLAEEEPDLTVIAYDPGPSDTELMAEIRAQARATMTPALAAAYHDLHDSGRLVRPDETARVLAWLATNAPKAWSGRVVSHTDAEAVNASRQALPTG
jgi:NAD(P)-dependent dehydrogenase (short-subunit alcohol dehydrogenase family)